MSLMLFNKFETCSWVVGISTIDFFRVLGLRKECPLWGVFLKDPSPYLREFWRKSRKIPNGFVDICDRGLNPAPPVYQFRGPICSATGRA